MADLELALKLTSDGNALRADVRASKKEFDALTLSVDQLNAAGRLVGQGMDAAGRGVAVFRSQAQLANQAAREAANDTTALGTAAAVSSTQVVSLGGAAAASSAGLRALDASAASAGGSVANAGRSLIVYEGNIQRIGRSTTLTGAAMQALGGAANASGDGVLRLGHSVDGTRSGLDAFVRSLLDTEEGTRTLGGTSSSTSLSVGQLAGMVSIAGAAIGLIAGKVAGYTDTMAGLRGQLKLVTADEVELNAVYSRALALANETGQSLETTVNLYARLSRSTEELNLSQNQLFTVTKAINQSFIVSGAATQEATAATLQLSQGLASGTLRGEELNSVMENSPRLARALADGLGVSIGQLRQMGTDGELTAEKVTNALQLMAGEIDAEFQLMPMTTGRVTQEIRNNLLDAFGAADSGPAIDSLHKFRDALADPKMKQNLRDLATLAIDAGAGIASLTAALLDLAPAPFTAIGEGLAHLIEKGRDLGLLKDKMDYLGIAVTGTAAEIQAAYDTLNSAPIKTDGIRELMAALKAAGDASADVARLTSSITDMKGEIADLEKTGWWPKQLDEAREKLKGLEAQLNAVQSGTTGSSNVMAGYNARLDAAKASINATTEELIKLLGASNDASAGTGKLTDAQKALISEQEAARKQLEQQRKGLASYIDDLEFEVKISKESAREQEILTAQRRYGTVATDANREAVRKLVGALYDQQEAARLAGEEQTRAADAAKQAAEDSAQAAEDAMQPWQDALQGMAESVDSGFTQAWGDAFRGTEDGFKNFAGNILDGFVNLLANMAHLAITRPIVMQISAAVTGQPTAAPVSKGSGVASGPGGTASAGALGGASFPLIGGAGFAALGITRQLDDVENGMYGYGDIISGNYFGKKYKDDFNSVIPGSGDAAEMAIDFAHGNPFGILDKPMEKLFGNANDGNNGARSQFNAATGSLSAAGSGKTFDQKNLDAATQFGQAINDFAALIGGSTLEGAIDVGNKDGIKFQGQKFKEVDKFMQYAFEEVLQGATELDDKVKTLLLARKGNASELARDAVDALSLDKVFQAGKTYFSGISDFGRTFEVLADNFRRDGEGIGDTIARLEAGLALLDAAGENAVRSVDNFKRAQDLIDKVGLATANNIVYTVNVIGDGLLKQYQSLKSQSRLTNLDIYDTLVAQNRALIESYNGTAESSAALAQATFARRDAELYLLTELDTVTRSITGRIAEFREQLTLDGLDTEAQYNRYRDQIGYVTALIAHAGSASQVDSLENRAEEFAKSAYGLLDDGQQALARPEFLNWLDTLEAVATDRLADLKTGVVGVSDDLDTKTQNAVWEKAGLAGENLQAAADDLQAAGGALAEVADRLSLSTGTLESAARQLRELLSTGQLGALA